MHYNKPVILLTINVQTSDDVAEMQSLEEISEPTREPDCLVAPAPPAPPAESLSAMVQVREDGDDMKSLEEGFR